MKETGIYKSLLKMKETLAPMTWGQRIEHIWINYKMTLLVTLIFVFLIGCLLTGMLTKKDILLGGVHANIHFSKEGEAYISSQFFDKCDANADKEEISTLSVTMTKIADDENFEMNYYYLKAVLARVGAQRADYILADKVALEVFLSQDIYIDLRAFFTEEELAQMEDRLIYVLPVDENEEQLESEKYPVAVNVSDFPFFANSVDAGQEVYFSIASNAPNMETVRLFWEHLCNWENQ